MEILEYQNPRTRTRRRWRRWLLLALALSLLIAGNWMLSSMTKTVLGVPITVKVTVRVIDVQTNKPIEKASIQSWDYRDLPTSAIITTDKSGMVAFRLPERATSQVNPVYSKFFCLGDKITVSAAGYYNQRVPPGSTETYKIFGMGPEPNVEMEVALYPLTANSVVPK